MDKKTIQNTNLCKYRKELFEQTLSGWSNKYGTSVEMDVRRQLPETKGYYQAITSSLENAERAVNDKNGSRPSGSRFLKYNSKFKLVEDARKASKTVRTYIFVPIETHGGRTSVQPPDNKR